MRTVTDTIIPSGSADLSSDWTSEPLQTTNIYILSIALVFTGSPNGTLSLQCSNDAYRSGEEPQNWTTIPGSSIAISEAGDHTWNFSSISFNWIRVVYTRTSGSATLTSAQYHGKGV